MAENNITKQLMLRQTGHRSKSQLEANVFQEFCQSIKISKCKEGKLRSCDRMRCVDIDRDGKYLLSGSLHGSVTLYGTSSYSKRKSYRNILKQLVRVQSSSCTIESRIETIQWFKQDSGLFISGGGDKKANVWDASNMKIVEIFHLHNGIYQIDLSPFENTSSVAAVTSATRNPVLIDLKSGQHIHELSGLKGGSLSCAWSTTTENLLAAGGLEQQVKIWDIRSWRRSIAELNLSDANDQSVTNRSGMVNGVTFTPDGNFLMAACDSTLTCWDARYFKDLHIQYSSFYNRQKPLNFKSASSGRLSVCFLPSANQIKVLNVKTGELIDTLEGHYGPVNCICVDMKTLQLFSCSDDNTIILWSSMELSSSSS